MHDFAQLCEAVAATTKKTEKTRLISEYLRTHESKTAAIAASFLSGRPFPRFEEATLNVGGALIWRIVSELSGANEGAIGAAYRRTGDTGAAAEIVLQEHAPRESTLTVLEVERAFRDIASARGTEAKLSELRTLLARATAVEAKYIVKVVTGDLRIGSKESLVEEAIALAFAQKADDVRRANMLLGDVGEALRLAADDALGTAKMRLFHPIGFMLASPADSSEEAFSYFSRAEVEDKYDGVRAQAHCSGGSVKLFSRTLDEITESFPEIAAALAQMPEDVILDGELLAWEAHAGEIATSFHSHHRGRALPFSALQKRLGRKKVAEKLMRDVPVAYVAFDVIYARGELVIDRPLHERSKMLDVVFASLSHHADAAPILRAPVVRVESAEELDVVFEKARERGNEGLMIKDLDSAYLPGRRGRSWLKLKRELATLDVVVTAAEWGNGRKSQWLSDYTFAVRDGEKLVNIGKAYSGVTDAEIQRLTEHFQQTTVIDNGHSRIVQPDTVLEVAFNNIMQSERHASGYALRFPRIVRIRDDKAPHDVDTLARVRKIFESEQKAGRAPKDVASKSA